eukprot:13109299-Alexandrium_andersonii.AAC.1
MGHTGPPALPPPRPRPPAPPGARTEHSAPNAPDQQQQRKTRLCAVRLIGLMKVFCNDFEPNSRKLLVFDIVKTSTRPHTHEHVAYLRTYKYGGAQVWMVRVDVVSDHEFHVRVPLEHHLLLDVMLGLHAKAMEPGYDVVLFLVPLVWTMPNLRVASRKGPVPRRHAAKMSFLKHCKCDRGRAGARDDGGHDAGASAPSVPANADGPSSDEALEALW